MQNLIIAGHYCLSEQFSELGPDSEAELSTWRAGLKFYRENQLNSKIILWINDIGIDNQRRQALKESYLLPASYQKVLHDENISINAVKIEFESSIRNKASTNIRQINKTTPELFRKTLSSEKNLVRCIDTTYCGPLDEKYAYVIEGLDGSDIVVKEGTNPKCNLILATLFHKYSKSQPVKIYNFFNAIYRKRIDIGIQVYKLVYLGDSVFVNEFHDFMGNIIVDKK